MTLTSKQEDDMLEAEHNRFCNCKICRKKLEIELSKNESKGINVSGIGI